MMGITKYFSDAFTKTALFLSLILTVKFRKYINWIILLIGTSTAQAQEEKYLDDTPQDIYNPTTTLFTTQKNIQYNRKGYKAISDDMGISGLHRFTFVQQHGNMLQNLGNNGTAIYPIFYSMPDTIGITSGFYAYDVYFRNPDQFRYYDTKSPYSKLYIILARFGSFYADVCHSRNVTPNWNIGANFRNIMADKEWIPHGRGDKNVISYGIDFFTHYKTDHERYQLLAHLLVAKHRVRETGGISTDKYRNNKENVVNTRLSTKQEIWYNNIDNPLVSNDLKKHPESIDARKHLHLYHQLALTEQLEVYQELDIQKQKNIFKADELVESAQFFLGYATETSNNRLETIETTTALWHAQNECGFIGDWQDWFYCGYYRYKRIGLRPQQERNNQDLHEHYVGLRTRYQLRNNTEYLHLRGEFLFSGFYKAHISYEGSHFDLAYNQMRHKPSFLTQCYDDGYLRKWNRQFSPPTAMQISGGFKMASSRVQVKPRVSFTSITDHIYFEHQFKGSRNKQRKTRIAEPKQIQERTNIMTIGTELDLSLGNHIHWDSELTAARTLGLGPSTETISIPAFLINTRLYYKDTTTVGNGTFETGIDVHWKSSYMACGYDPVTQQFYLQDEFIVHSYPIIDLFLNFRIKSFSAFLKFSHCNEFWLAPAPGYFTTPLYPGQKKAFDIGLNWSFFD